MSNFVEGGRFWESDKDERERKLYEVAPKLGAELRTSDSSTANEEAKPEVPDSRDAPQEDESE